MMSVSDLKAALKYSFAYGHDECDCFNAFHAGCEHARREMEGEIGDYKRALEAVIGEHHEAFLYEKRGDSNIPGSLDQPRNAYNITRTLAEMAREVLKKYGSKE